MLIFRRETWPEHRRWAYGTALTALVAAVWYGFEGARSGRWPGGGSLPGFAFGVAGGVIILFELLLPVRKRFRALRVGRAKWWLKAHIWLGLLSLPLLTLHSGFHWWGGPLAGALMMVFLVVIASGVWGLSVQHVLPEAMLREVPAETIHSQIDYLLAQLLDEASQLVAVTCGRDEPGRAGEAPERGHEKGFLVIGAVRSSGRVQGKVLQTRPQARAVAGSEPLATFFDDMVTPFLRAKDPSRLPLATARRSAALFQQLRTLLDPAAHPAVAVLEAACDQRRQLDRQARLHARLHVWLCVHGPLSVALLVLMIVHVYFALRYF